MSYTLDQGLSFLIDSLAWIVVAPLLIGLVVALFRQSGPSEGDGGGGRRWRSARPWPHHGWCRDPDAEPPALIHESGYPLAQYRIRNWKHWADDF